MSRRAYSRPCRFFRDSDVVSRVAWQDAAPDAPDLGEWSVILSKYLEPDDWLDDGPGEVADSPRTTTLATAPAGLPYTHVCGVPEDFERGCIRDEALPPVQYGALGYPLCCGAPKLTRGGAGMGGRATVTRMVPAPAPGLTCCTAPTLEVGVTYAGSVDAIDVPYVYAYATEPGQVYHMTRSRPPLTWTDLPLYDGPDCLGVSILPGTGTPLECVSWVARDVFLCVVHRAVTGPLGPYTWTVAEGPC